jgi:hypothetical protein
MFLNVIPMNSHCQAMYSLIAIIAMDYHIDLQMQRYEKYPTWQNKTATFCKKKESAPKLMGHPLLS